MFEATDNPILLSSFTFVNDDFFFSFYHKLRDLFPSPLLLSLSTIYLSLINTFVVCVCRREKTTKLPLCFLAHNTGVQTHINQASGRHFSFFPKPRSIDCDLKDHDYLWHRRSIDYKGLTSNKLQQKLFKFFSINMLGMNLLRGN